jgi:hypothetical protein
MRSDAAPAREGEAACPVCHGLTVARYDAGALPAFAPFCSRCRRRLRAVEIEPEERRRLSAAARAGEEAVQHERRCGVEGQRHA